MLSNFTMNLDRKGRDNVKVGIVDLSTLLEGIVWKESKTKREDRYKGSGNLGR